MPFTKKDIELLRARAKIRGYIIHEVNRSGNVPVAVKPNKTTSKAKEWIELNLTYWCNQKALSLDKEVLFDEKRKWRADWAIPALKILIEYNGLVSKKSRHTTIKGYSGDMEKINAAQQNGYTVFQYTVLTYKNLLTDLNKMFPEIG